MHAYVQRAAEMNRSRIIFRDCWYAYGGKRKRDSCFLAGPIKIVRLSQVEIEFERLQRIRGIAWFYGGDFAVKPIEGSYRLAELFPLRLRSAAESNAQRKFVVTADEVAKFRSELTQLVHLGINFDALG